MQTPLMNSLFQYAMQETKRPTASKTHGTRYVEISINQPTNETPRIRFYNGWKSGTRHLAVNAQLPNRSSFSCTFYGSFQSSTSPRGEVTRDPHTPHNPRKNLPATGTPPAQFYSPRSRKPGVSVRRRIKGLRSHEREREPHA